jgi:hypothetical protein
MIVRSILVGAMPVIIAEKRGLIQRGLVLVQKRRIRRYWFTNILVR